MIAYVLIGGALALGLYAFLGYPAALALLARVRDRRLPADPDAEAWPRVTISLPAYNEEAQIRGALDALLGLDYPADRRRILVISDGSTDATEQIVRSYAGRGVDLLALPERRGKTRAEAAAARVIDSDIVLNTDASIRLHPRCLRELVRALSDPAVGVASGRDVSVGVARAGQRNAGEGGYVGYEMLVRSLETRAGGIVGASGCCYAIRTSLHRLPLPAGLSRDFAAALHAREHGYRAVSVDAATCAVPRADSLRHEYRRKVRTMVRGMRTLAHKRGLLRIGKHGVFAWMLWSHKVARWALPFAGLAALAATAWLAATGAVWAQVALAGAAALGAVTALAWLRDGALPRPLALLAWAALGNIATVHAALRALGAEQSAIWEPTRRSGGTTAEAAQEGGA